MVEMEIPMVAVQNTLTPTPKIIFKQCRSSYPLHNVPISYLPESKVIPIKLSRVKSAAERPLSATSCADWKTLGALALASAPAGPKSLTKNPKRHSKGS